MGTALLHNRVLQSSKPKATLNSNSWDTISKTAAAGQAQNYWAVGDTKQIIINGMVGNTNFDSFPVWVFILGFNHNSSIEGNNTIHFQIGKDAQKDGKQLCLVDANYGKQVNTSGNFNMNPKSTYANSGGWSASYMRKTLLASTYTVNDSAPNSLSEALPRDLRVAMKMIKKYTDNVGSQSFLSSSVTATNDTLWLLAEYELRGTRTEANQYEKNYQKQYAYYANGNPKLFYKHNAPESPAGWWLRSVDQSMMKWCDTTSNGGINVYDGNYSLGICPCFCV